MRTLGLTELTERLVAFNTASPGAGNSTTDIADFISEYCEGAGFTIEQYPYHTTQGVENVNVIARKGGQKSRLALSGHMDTVAFNAEEWVGKKPLSLTARGNRCYGLGVADMKLFLAIAMQAGEAIDSSKLRNPFALCFTSDEEVGCLGMKKLRDTLTDESIHLADFVVIGEPTSMVPINMHKGYMFLKVEIGKKSEKGEKKKRGKHSSDPRQSINVIESCLPLVLREIAVFKRKLEGIVDERFNPPYPTMNVGVINTSDDAIKNVIPGYCKLELDIRPIPGQNIPALYEALSHVLQNSLSDIKNVPIKVSYVRAPTRPMETPGDALLVNVAKEITGKQALGVNFNTEGGILKNDLGIPSLIWGPGSIDDAHKPNEFIDRAYFQQSVVDQYTKLIQCICC